MSYELREYEGAAAATTLSSGITNASTSIAIADGTGWPDGSAGNFHVVIDRGLSSEEKIRIASRTSLTLTVDTSGRGADGTTAVAHDSGAPIEHCLTALDLSEANYAVAETVGKVTTAGDLLVADGLNSLDRLAKGSNSTVLGVNSGGTLGYATVATAQIANDAVTAAKIGADEIGTSEIAPLAVTAAELASDAVTTAKILDANVTADKIAAAVAGSGLTGGAGTALAVGVDDSTIEINSDALRVKDDGITAAKIAAGVVGLSELAAAGKTQCVTFTKVGTLTTGTGTIRFPFPFAATLLATRLACNTAPTGADLIIDVNKNGTTVYTTQGNRPEIEAAATASTVHTAPDVTSMSAGDYLTVDIDQVGSSVAGADLTIVVYYTLA